MTEAKWTMRVDGRGTGKTMRARIEALESWRRRLSEKLRPILDSEAKPEPATQFKAADNLKPHQPVFVASQASVDFAQWIDDEIRANRIPRPKGSPPSLFATGRQEIERLRAELAEARRTPPSVVRWSKEVVRQAGQFSKDPCTNSLDYAIVQLGQALSGLRASGEDVELKSPKTDGPVMLKVYLQSVDDCDAAYGNRPFQREAIEAYPRLASDANFRQGWFDNRHGDHVNKCRLAPGTAEVHYRQGWAARHDLERRIKPE